MRRPAVETRPLRSWGSVLLALTLGSGCADPRGVDRPKIEWQGAHLRAGGDLADLCQGSLPYMDAMVGQLQDRLATPGEGIVDYYHFGPDAGPAPLADFCRAGESEALLACANEDQEVFSRATPQEHELVHAVHAEAGFSHPFIEEGLAEYLGDDARNSVRGEPKGTLADAIASADTGSLPLGSYPLAGHFVSYLDQQLGDGFSERIDAVGFEDSTDAVEAALGVGFDGGFPGLAKQYEGQAACAQPAYRDASLMCNVAAPLFETCGPEQDAMVEVNVDCSEGDVLGPRDGEIWTYRTMDIAAPGTYYILAQAETAAMANGLEIKRCSGGCDAPPILVDIYDSIVEEPVDEVPFPVDVELEAGLYLLRVSRPTSDSATVYIEFGGAGCD